MGSFPGNSSNPISNDPYPPAGARLDKIVTDAVQQAIKPLIGITSGRGSSICKGLNQSKHRIHPA
jgi:hypothetical protein